MKSLLKGFITSFLSVYFTSQIKSGLLIKNGWQGYFSSALLLLLRLYYFIFIRIFHFSNQVGSVD